MFKKNPKQVSLLNTYFESLLLNKNPGIDCCHWFLTDFFRLLAGRPVVPQWVRLLANDVLRDIVTAMVDLVGCWHDLDVG